MSDESSNDDDLDFDRPKIKPPNPEGFVKKKGRSNKKDKHRKRKKSGERDLHRANRVDERRERHIKRLVNTKFSFTVFILFTNNIPSI